MKRLWHDLPEELALHIMSFLFSGKEFCKKCKKIKEENHVCWYKMGKLRFKPAPCIRSTCFFIDVILASMICFGMLLWGAYIYYNAI